MPVFRSVNKKYFKTWNSNMAYILGFLFADGTITVTKRDTHYVAFHSEDRQLLERIRACLQAQQKLSKRSARSGNVYRLQIGSREMVLDLKKLGLDGIKARRMLFPDIPKKFFGDFVRGYFDGDGNVWVGKRNGGLVIVSAFTSASHAFLQVLHEMLYAHGVQGGSLYLHSRKECSRLSFSKRDSLKLCKIMYNTLTSNSLYLQRKKRVFDAFLKEMRT